MQFGQKGRKGPHFWGSTDGYGNKVAPGQSFISTKFPQHSKTFETLYFLSKKNIFSYRKHCLAIQSGNIKWDRQLSLQSNYYLRFLCRDFSLVENMVNFEKLQPFHVFQFVWNLVFYKIVCSNMWYGYCCCSVQNLLQVQSFCLVSQ